jgi:hypothetical protein
MGSKCKLAAKWSDWAFRCKQIKLGTNGLIRDLQFFLSGVLPPHYIVPSTWPHLQSVLRDGRCDSSWESKNGRRKGGGTWKKEKLKIGINYFEAVEPTILQLYLAPPSLKTNVLSKYVPVPSYLFLWHARDCLLLLAGRAGGVTTGGPSSQLP